MKNEKILIFSYYSNIAGACQAEWIDDKIDGLLSGGKDISLISSVSGNKSDMNILHMRIPSISLVDYIDELRRAHLAKDLLQLSIFIIFPFVLTLGVLLDLLLIIATRGVGEGRWSWLISASIAGVYGAIRFKPNKILTTGGPASAHLAGIIIGKLFSLPVISELQDPMSGEGIGRNIQAKGWLYKVEKYIIHNANITVYVTDAAAKFAKKEFKTEKVRSMYPGAKNFGYKHVTNKNKVFKIVHLGSLYSGRSFDNIITAIDKMIKRGDIKENDIELINLGHVSTEERCKIIGKSYVKIYKPIPRRKALEFASKCNISLLIQHIDNRSKVTIPYKTYDYLNLGNHILALLRSNELTKLIKHHGHSALAIEDTSQISKYLFDAMNNKAKIKKTKGIDYVAQAIQLVNTVKLSSNIEK